MDFPYTYVAIYVGIMKHPSNIKLIYSEKATHLKKKIFHFGSTLGNVKKIGIFFSNFVTFSQFMNFKVDDHVS